MRKSLLQRRSEPHTPPRGHAEWPYPRPARAPRRARSPRRDCRQSAAHALDGRRLLRARLTRRSAFRLRGPVALRRSAITEPQREDNVVGRRPPLDAATTYGGREAMLLRRNTENRNDGVLPEAHDRHARASGGRANKFADRDPRAPLALMGCKLPRRFWTAARFAARSPTGARTQAATLVRGACRRAARQSPSGRAFRAPVCGHARPHTPAALRCG